MACVTLKRSCIFDLMYGVPSKRARHAAVVLSMTVTSPGRARPFVELPRKISPKKMPTPTNVPLQKIRGRRFKFDEAARRVPERIIHGDRYEESEDQPMFTFGQLKLICERRLEEQAQRIREDYDQILHEKISEQYDTFVKFTHDQIMRGNYKPEALPSYLS